MTLLIGLICLIVALITMAPKMAAGELRNLGDANLKTTTTLPDASGTSAATTKTMCIIDTEALTTGAHQPDVDFLLTAPALNGTQLPDTKTAVYDIIESANSDGSSPTTIIDNAITQTGSGTNGADSATNRFRIPPNAKRYIGVIVTIAAASGDCSGASASMELLV